MRLVVGVPGLWDNRGAVGTMFALSCLHLLSCDIMQG